MTRDLTRLLRPRALAVVGGGAWAALVIEQCRKMGFEGPIWPVHPKADHIASLPAFASVEALPGTPDACFVGVNRFATIEVVRALSKRGAGGAVCFASGFQEAQAEDAQGADLQAQLIEAAGDMPFLGPNCYGFVNYLDGALLWPDQHGGRRVERGVALVTQSSNIAINLTMQRRGLPVAYVVTAGNQAQSGIAELGRALLDDPRVTALGLHIEGFGDMEGFQGLAAHARQLGKPIVALKVGKSDQAQAATLSHTASLAGGDAGAGALLDRLGILRVADLPVFLETLKLLHVTGRLPQNTLATISCSGGEASLAADLCHDLPLELPPLSPAQTDGLRAALGPMVALANPLDYHTYIWRDTGAMTRTFAAMADPRLAMILLIVDFPRADRCDPADWSPTVAATIAAARQTGGRYGMVATLPELMPEEVAADLLSAGVVPFCGLSDALHAIAAATTPLPPEAPALLCATPTHGPTRVIPEAEAKQTLAAYGVPVPQSQRVATPEQAAHAATQIGFPVVLKGEGHAHKTEAGAVALSLTSPEAVRDAATRMNSPAFLVEQMIQDPVAELLVGVILDPAHGFVLTLGAGGTLTEILQDSVSLLLPATPQMIDAALDGLRIAPILAGYRGKPGVERAQIHAALDALQRYVADHADTILEVEINPLLCTPTAAIAADALIRRKD